MMSKSSEDIALLNVLSRVCLYCGCRNNITSLAAKYCDNVKHNNVSSSKLFGLNTLKREKKDLNP